MPASATQVQDCLRQILRLFTIVEALEPTRCPALLFVPGVLAATVALTAEDRNKISELLKGYDSVMGIVQDREFIQRVWAASDESGHQIDWHDLASETVGPAFL